MDLLKSILIDSMNGLSPRSISFFVFQILIAGLTSHVFQLIWQKKQKYKDTHTFAIVAIAMTLLSIFAKYSVGIAIVGLAAVLWSNKGQKLSKKSSMGFLISSIIGVGIGSGNVVLTCIGLIVLGVILLFSKMVNEDENPA